MRARRVEAPFEHVAVDHDRARDFALVAPLSLGTDIDQRRASFDGLRRVNAGASYRLPLGEFRAVRFFVRAENLLDQNYFENGFRTPGRTANGGIQFEF